MTLNNKEQRQLKHFKRMSLLASLAIATGTIFYHFIEGLNWLDSLYLAVVTITTLGYGDITPQTSAGKLFTIVYVLIGIAIIVSYINSFSRVRRIIRNNNKNKNNK